MCIGVECRASSSSNLAPNVEQAAAARVSHVVLNLAVSTCLGDATHRERDRFPRLFHD